LINGAEDFSERGFSEEALSPELPEEDRLCQLPLFFG
jgi:hypothetical protein